jgi:hypothetical protein
MLGPLFCTFHDTAIMLDLNVEGICRTKMDLDYATIGVHTKHGKKDVDSCRTKPALATNCNMVRDLTIWLDET